MRAGLIQSAAGLTSKDQGLSKKRVIRLQMAVWTFLLSVEPLDSGLKAAASTLLDSPVRQLAFQLCKLYQIIYIYLVGNTNSSPRIFLATHVIMNDLIIHLHYLFNIQPRVTVTLKNT